VFGVAIACLVVHPLKFGVESLMKRCEGTSNNTLIFVQSQVALINLLSVVLVQEPTKFNRHRRHLRGRVVSQPGWA
jgi:hypothetical protein